MDRSILEGDPHSVLEGLIIAGYAAGAGRVSSTFGPSPWRLNGPGSDRTGHRKQIFGKEHFTVRL